MVLIPILLVVLYSCSLDTHFVSSTLPNAPQRDDNHDASTALQLPSPSSIQSYEQDEEVPRPRHVEAEDFAVQQRELADGNWLDSLLS